MNRTRPALFCDGPGPTPHAQDRTASTSAFLPLCSYFRAPAQPPPALASAPAILSARPLLLFASLRRCRRLRYPVMHIVCASLQHKRAPMWREARQTAASPLALGLRAMVPAPPPLLLVCLPRAWHMRSPVVAAEPGEFALSVAAAGDKAPEQWMGWACSSCCSNPRSPPWRSCTRGGSDWGEDGRGEAKIRLRGVWGDVSRTPLSHSPQSYARGEILPPPPPEGFEGRRRVSVGRAPETAAGAQTTPPPRRPRAPALLSERTPGRGRSCLPWPFRSPLVRRGGWWSCLVPPSHTPRVLLV